VNSNPTDLMALLANPPNLHGGTTHSLVRGALQWIDRLPRPLRTLETGCGLSTLVFALRGDEHACITPYASEPDAVKDYCAQHGIDASRVTFHIDTSEIILPHLDSAPLDVILIDGSHAFPHVFIDYFYSTSALAVGGTLILDDVHLWTGKVLRDFLNSEPEWRLVQQWDGRTAAFEKIAELESRDWFDQPYVNSRSGPWRARSRMALALLRQKDLLTLERYIRGMVTKGD
jgi:predicted O-methyltransferase YrrM